MIPVLLGVAFLVFTILSLTPGDPGSIILGITAKPEDIAALNAEFGYDKPFLIRFFNYIGDIIFHFSLGYLLPEPRSGHGGYYVTFSEHADTGCFIDGCILDYRNFSRYSFSSAAVFCAGSRLCGGSADLRIDCRASGSD